MNTVNALYFGDQMLHVRTFWAADWGNEYYNIVLEPKLRKENTFRTRVHEGFWRTLGKEIESSDIRR